MAKMSNKKFRTILVPITTLLLATGVIASITANQYSASLDFAFGRGEKHIESIEGINADDLKFYQRNYATAQDSRLAARDVAQEVEAQGAVLLKNNNNLLPLQKKTNVTPFGFRFVSPFYGGSGSANIDTSDAYVITAEQGLRDNFTVNETVISKMKASTEEKMICDDKNDPTDLSEYNANIYQGTESSCTNTTGIVYLARPGTEGYDLNSTRPYSDGTQTQLELTVNEKNMIKFAKDHCKNVVVLLITPTPMMVQSLQNDTKIDSIIWVGLPGAGGYRAVSEILDGAVNPSGKLPDIWYSDFYNDPTYMNHLTGAYKY